MKIWVETRENEQGDHEPCQFRLGASTLDVAAVLDRWLHWDHGYFKVQVSDGGIYILHHDAETDCWEISLYESSRLPRQLVLPEVSRRQ